MKKILDNIEIESSGCWVWKKSCSSSGYGQFTSNKVYWNTHRYVWCIINGDIPDGLVIRHKCHNRKCCNPEHLLLGTPLDNYIDSKDTHEKANKEKSHKWIIDGNVYHGLVEAIKNSGISNSTIIKYTDKKTRIFDMLSYNNGCIIANKKRKYRG